MDKTNATHRAIAKILGISHPAVTKLVAKGMPTQTVERAKEWYEVWRQREGSDINAVRKEKLQREVERLDLKIKRERGELVAATQVAEEAQQIAAVLCSEGQAMISDLRGQLAGLDEVAIGERLLARWTQLLIRTQKRLGLD